MAAPERMSYAMAPDNHVEALMNPNILAAIMDASSDGFTYTDETGLIVYNNRAYSELTGLPDEQIRGHNIHSLVSEGYPISRMALEVFRDRNKQSKLIKYQADSERVLLVTISPVYDGTGIFRGVVGNVRDMTELMQLRQQLDVIYLDYGKEMEAKEETNRVLHRRICEMLYLMEDYDILGRSKSMHSLAELALRVSNVQSTVLITGESGVGKDVFCKMISKFSSGDGYLKISCGTIPEHLLESELFGYEPGAFTGANRSGKQGIFEAAGEGVLFLDEIGEMPLQLQVKLLTVLQDRQYYRIGGTKALPMNARIVAATNRNLKEEVKKGAFRQDLYYRLNVIPVHIPSLRERREDILPLAEHILGRLNRKNNTAKVLGVDLQRCMLAYDWPGNIRELSNLVERVYVLAPSEVLGTDDLPKEMVVSGLLSQDELHRGGHGLKDMMAAVEAALLARQLREDRTLRETAAILDIDISTLVRKISRYNLPKRYKQEEKR